MLNRNIAFMSVGVKTVWLKFYKSTLMLFNKLIRKTDGINPLCLCASVVQKPFAPLRFLSASHTHSFEKFGFYRQIASYSGVKMVTVLSLFALMLIALPINAQDGNLTDACVPEGEYNADTDYFPSKITVSDADNFSIDYFNNYKVVTVNDAFDGAEAFTYVLVQCGTPAPSADAVPDGAQFINVPVDSIITLSTTQLPHLRDLNRLDNLVGVDSFLYINTPEVIEKINAGELVEVGYGGDINVETVLDLEPDMVMTYGFNPATDAHPVLSEAGIFTALNAEWREASPLGRAEWIKYTALFFNEEAEATDDYNAIADAYNEAVALVADIPDDQRPVVLWNAFSSWDDAWIIPAANTYTGQLINDAGGVIALGDQAQEDSAFVAFEVIYDGALDADVWMINAYGVATPDDLLAQDERYADFEAFQNGAVWNNDADVNENFGSNYYELGVTNPHLILQDMVAMFYPELMPDHEFVFHRLITDGE